MDICRPQINRRRLLAYAILFTLLGLAVIEIAARLVEPTAYRLARDFQSGDTRTEYKLWQQTLFASFGGIHQPDPELLWTFRPHLRQPLFFTNSQGLLNREELGVEKPPNTVRILLLGDSSPVGLGLQSREEAFGELATRLLNTRWRGRQRFELINAAVSGYTSEQGKRYLQSRGWQYQPDFVVCYFGNNDASINGLLTDREIFAAQNWALQTRSVMFHLATYRLLRGLLSPALPKRRTGEEETPVVRLTPAEFGENLTSMATTARQSSAEIILVNPPVPYRWPAGLQFKIFSRMADSAGHRVVAETMQSRLERQVAYCLDPAEANRPYGRIDPYVREVFTSAYRDHGRFDSLQVVYQTRLQDNPDDQISKNNLGVIYWREQRYPEAIVLFEQCLLVDSTFNVARFNLGIALSAKGDSLRAAEVLRETVDRDYYSLRIKTPYRRALFAVAEQTNAVVLDAADLFARYDNERLFIDHCHPTPEGHQLIAGQLVDLIDSLLKESNLR